MGDKYKMNRRQFEIELRMCAYEQGYGILIDGKKHIYWPVIFDIWDILMDVNINNLKPSKFKSSMKGITTS